MKQFFVSLAMVLFVLIANVDVVSAETEYKLTADFNALTTGIPTGWDNAEGTTTNPDYRWTCFTPGYTGNCLRFNSYSNSNGYDNYLKTPTMDLSTGSWVLRFWYKNPTQGPLFKVYISTNGGASRTLLKDMTANPTVWTFEEINITAAANGSQNVVIYFYGQSNYGSSYDNSHIFLDDVTVQSETQCKAPQGFIVSNLTTTTATISWGLTTGLFDPTTYSYELRTAGGTLVESNASLSAPGNTHSITGLAANTTYVATLQGNCNVSGGGLSDEASVTFTTMCNAQPAPYYNDFDALTSMPECTFSANASLVTGGRLGKAIALATTEADGAYVVFPELTLSSDTVQFSAWLRTSSISGGTTPVQVGIVTDPSDVFGSFEPLYSGYLASTSWTEVRMNTALTQQPVTGSTMIAISIPAGFIRTTYLDEVSIIPIPSCVRPEDFDLSNVTSSSVDLAWTTTNVPNVRVKIMSATDTIYQTATSSPYTVTGLQPNTQYDFQIWGVCSATDSSEVNPYTLSARTTCVTATTPLFAENFDNLTASQLPDCWLTGWMVKPSDNTKSVPFAVASNFAHSGSNAMSLVDQASGSKSYLTSRCIPIDQAGAYTFSVWVYRQDAAYYPDEGLKFWVSSNFNDTTGATLLGYVPRHYLSAPAEASYNEWFNYEYVINTTGNVYILIEGVSTFGAATYFDDVQVKVTPNCMKVSNIALGTPEADNVDITWTAGKDETQWIVNYKLIQNGNVLSTVCDTVSTNSVNIANLVAATSYVVTGSVRSYCGGTEVSDSVSFNRTFVTACDELTVLPYTCGFESTETQTGSNPLPLCWLRYNDSPSYNYYPYVYNYGSARTGSGCLNFYPITSSYSDYGANQVAILPQVDVTVHPINTLQAVFFAALSSNYSAGVKVIVGVMSDPSDLSTFVAMDSTLITNSSYTKCSFPLSNYAGTGSYIAIRVPRASTSSIALYVDDAKIEVIPNCPDIAGDGVTVDNIGSNSAKITLTDQTASAAWSYAYGVHGMPMAQCTVVDTTGMNVVIDELDAQTTYDVYVRRRCVGENGAWSDPVTFTTQCSAVTLPFTDDFEVASLDSLKGCYNVDNIPYYFLKVATSTSTATGNYQYNHTIGGSKGVVSSSEWSTPYDASGSYRLLAFAHLEAGKNYEISVYAKAGMGYSAMEDWNITFQNGLALNSLQDITTLHVGSTDWERYNTYFSVDNTGDYYVGFSTSAGNNASYYYVFFDDIAIEEVSCIPPTRSFVSSISSNAATISLTSSSSSWLVAVSSTPIDITGTVTGDIMYDTIHTPSFTLNGLGVNTEYYYTIKSVCTDGGMSSWMQPSSFRTLCSSFQVPYTEGFEDMGSTLCWSTLGGTGTIARGTTANTGYGAMTVSAASALSPQFNVTTLAPFSISGWAYSVTDGASFDILVGTDPSDVASFVPMTTVTIPTANTWVEFYCSFDSLLLPDYSDYYNSRYIAFGCGSQTFYFDDLYVDEPPTCPKPSQGSITEVGPHSATIGWTVNGDATSWVVEARPAQGQSVYVNTTTNSVTITGLDATTRYTAYVRAICYGNDTSYQYKAGTFTTSCDYVTAPYTETFEGFDDATVPMCWDNTASTTSSVTDNPSYVWGINTVNSNKAMRMYNLWVRSGSALTNSPEIILDAAKSYELRYDYCNNANAGNLMVYVKRHSENAFTQLVGQHAESGSTSTDAPLFQTYVYPLDSYAGDTIQVQFFTSANYSNGAIYVDNVKVRELSTCVEPVTVTASGVSATGATINFTDSVAAHTAWEYAYGVKGFNVSTATPVSITAKSFALTGLTSSTSYDVYVRAVCSATDKSPWVLATFKTTSTPAALPYYTDFSDNTLNAAWDFFGSGSNSFVFGTDGNALFASGAAALYVSSAGSYGYNTTSATNIAIARIFAFDEASYNIEFDWRCTGGESNYDFARFYLVPANVSPLPTSGYNYSSYGWPSGLIELDGNQPQMGVSGDQHLSRVIDFTGRAGSYYLVFTWANDGGGGVSAYPLAVSNLSVSELTCQLITGPEVIASSVTLNSVSATCTNPNPGSTLRWAVSTSNMIADTIMSGIATTDTFTVTGLNPSSLYYMFFQAECSAFDKSPWVSIQFTTACGVITDFPFIQDFEAPLFPPVCWSNVSTASGSDYSGSPVPGAWERDIYSYTQYGHDQAWIKLTGYTGSAALLTTPALHFDAGREYHVSFAMYHYGDEYYTDPVYVYVGPNPNKNGAVKIGSFVVYDEDLQSYAYAVSTHDMDIPATMTGGDFYVMFEGAIQSYAMTYIDDIMVDEYPLCRELTENPTCVATTANTAVVSQNLGNRSAINFGIAPYSTSPNPATITDTIVSATGVATFTGLTNGTSYLLYARGICNDSGDTTTWTGPTVITTKADDCFAPDGVHIVGNISDSSAVVAWNPVPDAQEYQCEMTTVAGGAVQRFTVTEPEASFFTLNANSLYQFKVRAICGAGDTTAFTTALSIKTLRTPAYIPYNTGYEATDDNTLWNIVTSGYSNNFVFGTNSGGVHNGSQGLYISNNGSAYGQTVPSDGGYNNVYNIAYATRTVYFPEAGNYDISFDWKCDPSTDGTWDYYSAFGRAFLAPTDAVLTADDPQYQRKAPAGAIVLGSDLDNSQAWQTSNNVVAIDEPCYRDVVFMWFALNKYGYGTAYECTDYPLALDNFSVTQIACLPPTSIAAIGVSDTFGSVVVEKAEAVDLQYAILTVNSKDSIQNYTTLSSSVLRDTINFTGLTPFTQYYVFVRTACDDTHIGDWRMVALKTTNVPAPLPYVCGFEDNNENLLWEYSQGGTNHFMVGSATSNAGVQSIYITNDNVGNTYDAATTTYTYAARIFYLAEGLYEYSYDWKAYGESTCDYGRIVMIPADVTLTDGQPLTGLSAYNTPANGFALDGGAYRNQATEYVSVADTFRITTPGSYKLLLYWENDYAGGTNPPLSVDNIMLKAVTCMPATASIVASATTQTSVTAVVNNNAPGSSLVYAASTTGSYEDAVLVDTIAYQAGRDTLVINGLSPSTNYTLMVRSLCGADDESIWTRVAFKTLCGVVNSFPYYEGFEVIGTTYVSGLSDEICWSSLNDNSSYPTYHGTTSYSHEGDACLMMHSSSSSDLYLALPEMTDINNLSLSFAMRSEGTTSSTGIIEAGYMTNVHDATTFVSLVTTTRNTSWASYSTIITNAPAGARIAFKYGGAQSTNYYSWLDAVRVADFVAAPAYYDTVCYNKPYTLHGFNQAATTMQVGDNTFTRVKYATAAGEKDTLFTAYVYMRASIASVTYDTICAGQPYVRGLWNLPSPITNAYRQTFQGASACGCDSSVVLNLTVIPTSHVITDTICHGDSYQFGDSTITTSGMYTRSYTTFCQCPCNDTLYLLVTPDSVFETAQICQNNLPYSWYGQSLTTSGRHYQTIMGTHGCMQTAVLDLTVYMTDSTGTLSFCQGGSVMVIDTIVTTPGTYTRIRVNQFGCDVTYHMTVSEIAPVPSHTSDYACEGVPYSGFGVSGIIVTQDTTVIINTHTVDAQCDSVSYVHLTYTQTQRTDTTASIPEGATFTWHGNTYNESGHYKDTVRSVVTNCDSIITLHLTVGGVPPTGVGTVADVNMTVVPNPVNAGATAFVYGEFGEVAKVEILNNFGQLVESFKPETYPIEVSGISAAGLYYVRVTTKAGSVHLEKLIVR